MQEMLAPMAVPYSPDYFTPDENQQVRRESIPFIYYDQKAAAKLADFEKGEDVEDQEWKRVEAAYSSFQLSLGFKVTDEAERFLKSIKGRLGVIGVAGKYRTGKSFLLNRVILSKINEGFGVGPTINPCTKGLWVWGEPIHGKARDGSDLTIIVVDSEGIGSTNEDQNHDTRIFLLTLLLSSYFIFNSSGTIDETALQNLSLIVNLTKQLQVRSQVSEENDPEEIARYFPNFLWVVRDFSLRLVDEEKNPITAKQYLEKALKEKNGTSDAVMNKNRIRRLITLFFKERDCFTMVRPHEDQDKLQKLQSLADEELREEFVRDITQLRNKIYVKVKPKQMNSKFVNGAMLLELAKSYVQAINSGSVPCIENAWTYVCKNECERAIQQSISQYEVEFERRVGGSMTKLTLQELKALSKELRDKSLAFFKSKAVGEVQEFENKLRDVIGEKFKYFKQRFFKLQRVSESSQPQDIIEEKIETDLRDLDLNIRNGFYTNILDFTQDLNKMKEKIKKQHSGSLSLADQILKEMTEPLVIKAAQYITRHSETETSSKVKQLEEKLHMIEKESLQKKGELENEIYKQANMISHLEQESAALKIKETLMNEKLQRMEREKDQIEDKLQRQLRMATEEKERAEQVWVSKLRENEQRSRTSELESLQKINDLEKQNALIAQEMAFNKRNLQDIKVQQEKVEKELKYVNGLVDQKDHEIQDIKSHYESREVDYKEEIEELKSSYQTELEKAQVGWIVNHQARGGQQFSEITMKKFEEINKERRFLEEQLQFAKLQLDENKKIHETLTRAINRDREEERKSHHLFETNRNLTSTMQRMESRCGDMQQKIDRLKRFQRMIKYSTQLQCRFCQKFFPSEMFSAHLSVCNNDGSQRGLVLHNSTPLQIQILQTQIREEEDHKPYTVGVQPNLQEYVIEVSVNGENKWKIHRRYKLFSQLNDTLKHFFPNVKFPEFSQALQAKSLGDLNSGPKQSCMIEERRRYLQQYLLDLALIPIVRDSHYYKKFLEIDQHVPEEADNAYNGLLQSSSDFMYHQ